MERCKISICIPVYNVEKYIGRCIESIWNQSFKDIEIVIVNDCSPDKSMDIVRHYAETDSRIKIIEHDVNHGLMMARRTGYMAAMGEFITFCDSDDTLADGALESLYNKAIQTNADIVSGVIEYIPTKGKRFQWNNQLRYGSDKISVFKSLLKNEFETYEKATNGEDGMLFYQVVDYVTNVATIDKIVYEYWQNLESSSQVRLKDNALRSIALLNAIRVKTISKYSVLSALLNKKVSCVFWDLKANGYNMDPLYMNVGLGRFCNYSSLIKDLGLVEAVKIVLRLLLGKK